MWIIFVVIIFLLFIFYIFYLKEYVEVKRIFDSLEKTLDTRDLLVMKLLPEIKDEKIKTEVAKWIDLRVKNRKSSFNDKIKIDVELNKELKEFYTLINKITNNEVIKATFTNIIELEKKLKNIRNEYNIAVEKYNMNLVMHKFMCMRIIRMKPLDTYNVTNNEE